MMTNKKYIAIETNSKNDPHDSGSEGVSRHSLISLKIFISIFKHILLYIQRFKAFQSIFNTFYHP